MRPGYQRVRCVECGVSRTDALDGFISTRGKCKVCGLMAQLENVAGIEHSLGVPYQRWRLGIIARLLPREIVKALWDAGVFEPVPSPALDELRRAA
jgi:hypothetical protein